MRPAARCSPMMSVSARPMSPPRSSAMPSVRSSWRPPRCATCGAAHSPPRAPRQSSPATPRSAAAACRPGRSRSSCSMRRIMRARRAPAGMPRSRDSPPAPACSRSPPRPCITRAMISPPSSRSSSARAPGRWRMRNSRDAWCAARMRISRPARSRRSRLRGGSRPAMTSKCSATSSRSRRRCRHRMAATAARSSRGDSPASGRRAAPRSWVRCDAGSAAPRRSAPRWRKAAIPAARSSPPGPPRMT